AVTSACCVGLVAFLPTLALRAVLFPIEAPIGGAVVDEFDNEPVDTAAVAARIERSDEILTGFVAGVGVAMIACIAILGFPGSGARTAWTGAALLWAQRLSGVIAMLALCQSRIFRRRNQVLTLALSGVVGLGLVVVSVSIHARPSTRSSWLPVLLGLAAFA